MSNDTITPPETQPEETVEKNFVTLSSLRNYATATASLTVVINVLLYFYASLRSGKVMPLQLLIPLATILSLAYILSFFKRDKGLTPAQYVWITGLNSLMLFTSISGVNGMLDSARQTFAKANYSSPSAAIVQTASFGSFLKHILFPTHGWFNPSEMDERERKQVIQSAISTIDTTQKLIDTLIQQKQRDINTIDTLHKKLDSVRKKYIKTLDQFTQTESTVSQLTSLVNERNMQTNVRIQLTQLQTTIEINKVELVQQKQQQEQQQQNQVQQELEQKPVQQLQQQQQQLQQQKRQLRRQQQIQQFQPQQQQQQKIR